MTFVEIVLLALALTADAFSVGAGVGLTHCTPRQIFRLSFHFGLFQSLMPLLGWLLGWWLLDWVENFAPWIAFGLLAGIGLKMFVDGLRRKTEGAECREDDPTCGLSLVGLSLAVSLDAFAVGVSLGLTMGTGRFLGAVLIFGVVAGSGTWLGMRLGGWMGSRVGPRINALGGLVLIGLGLRMLWI